MKILHLETSSKNCSVAISEGKKLLCLCEETSENYKQSELLHTFVKWATEGARISLKELDAVSLGAGPGSYTGLRIGASAAKGFCYGLNIPLIAVNCLETLAAPFLATDFDLVIPMADARRMEVSCAEYGGNSGQVIEKTEAKVLDETSYRLLIDKNVLIAGGGAHKGEEILQLLYATFNAEVLPSAPYLIGKAADKFEAQNFEDIAYFEPYYLKDFQGVKKK